LDLTIQVVHAKEIVRVIPHVVLDSKNMGEMLLVAVTLTIPAEDPNILFDCRMTTVQMTLTDVTGVVKVALDHRDRFRRKLAFLLPKDGIGYTLIKFLEVYATNRGIRIQVFDSFEEAFNWLMPSPTAVTPDDDG